MSQSGSGPLTTSCGTEVPIRVQGKKSYPQCVSIADKNTLNETARGTRDDAVYGDSERGWDAWGSSALFGSRQRVVPNCPPAQNQAGFCDAAARVVARRTSRPMKWSVSSAANWSMRNSLPEQIRDQPNGANFCDASASHGRWSPNMRNTGCSPDLSEKLSGTSAVAPSTSA